MTVAGKGKSVLANADALANADQLAVAERLGSVAVWARRKFSVPMSSSAVSTLVTLERSGPLRVSELAEREQLTQPGMTTLVNRLEHDRYAERVADPTDGRARLVRLTADGRTFIAGQRRARRQSLLAEVARLSPAHQQALFDAIDALDQLTGSGTAPTDERASSDERPSAERPTSTGATR